jgi:hypothetical protein
MRIVSQDGKLDINYDSYDICISDDGYALEARNVYNPKFTIRIGDFSNTAKVRKVMRNISYLYKGYQEYGDNNSVIPTKFIPPKVFIIPQDKDVKVNYE